MKIIDFVSVHTVIPALVSREKDAALEELAVGCHSCRASGLQPRRDGVEGGEGLRDGTLVGIGTTQIFTSIASVMMNVLRRFAQLPTIAQQRRSPSV